MNHKRWCLCWVVFSLARSLFGQDFYLPPLLAQAVLQPPEVGSEAAILIDARTGTVLYAKNAHEEIPPASLAKLMTLHLLMKEIEAGRLSLDMIVPLPPESWARNQPPRSSLMYLAPGQRVTLRQIMLGLAIPSGNDAAVAAALLLAPTVDDFAAMMTAQARGMGMPKTRFVEPSGISEDNMTTAAEFVFFCRDYWFLHPHSLDELHSVPSFAFPTETNIHFNRNNLLKTFPGVDGFKTGYIDEAGYNIAITAQREDTRFIAVLLGAPADSSGPRIRDGDSARLLSWAFANFKTVRPLVPRIEKARLWKGKTNSVELELQEPADFTSVRERGDTLSFETVLTHWLIAPLPVGSPAGYLVISDEQGEVNRVALVAASSGEKGNIFKRILHSIMLVFKKQP